jgi:hypothetical protein
MEDHDTRVHRELERRSPRIREEVLEALLERRVRTSTEERGREIGRASCRERVS